MEILRAQRLAVNVFNPFLGLNLSVLRVVNILVHGLLFLGKLLILNGIEGLVAILYLFIRFVVNGHALMESL